MKTPRATKFLSMSLISILTCVSCATAADSNKNISKLERVNNTYIETLQGVEDAHMSCDRMALEPSCQASHIT